MSVWFAALAGRRQDQGGEKWLVWGWFGEFYAFSRSCGLTGPKPGA